MCAVLLQVLRLLLFALTSPARVVFQHLMMTIHASRFTPEVLLSAPRRSAGTPNSTGELVLYTVRTIPRPIGLYRNGSDHSQVSSYSFKSHGKSSQIRVLNVKEGSSHLVSEDPAASEPFWITESDIAFLKPSDHGCTMLVSQSVLDKSVK